ncbi:MAG: hypothetical protein ABDK94_10595 [Atribacterota bacterium]
MRDIALFGVNQINYISAYCSKALIGELSPEEAMRQLDREVERVLKLRGMK